MIAKQELHQMIDQLPDETLITAKSFLEWLVTDKSSDVKKQRISLKGISKGSSVTEEDIKEAKRIWQLQ